MWLGVAGAVTALSGCGKAQRTLRTPAQSAAFVATVARGGNFDDWKLPAHADDRAVRAWAERYLIQDLGAHLRREGGKWAIRLGGFGVFSRGDKESLVATAKVLGAGDKQIAAVLTDVGKLRLVDLREATAAACMT
jgi:hypothetical protein